VLHVEATARESGALFLAVRPSDLLSKYQGESEKYLRAIFSTAKSSSKCIIFFDGTT
jgi:SpoVK/Ycf46/Vps4 family AAA+-type ATPase